MGEHQKIICADAKDRDSLIVILARNGYTVRHHKEKIGKNTTYTYYVEFWMGRGQT